MQNFKIYPQEIVRNDKYFVVHAADCSKCKKYETIFGEVTITCGKTAEDAVQKDLITMGISELGYTHKNYRIEPCCRDAKSVN